MGGVGNHYTFLYFFLSLINDGSELFCGQIFDYLKSYFDTFGFLFIKNLFTQNEIEKMASASEKIFELNEDIDKEGAQQIVPFIERSLELTKFIVDPRVYQIVANLLGKDFLWVASEGNLTTKTYHEWHPDRTGTQRQIEFKR